MKITTKIICGSKNNQHNPADYSRQLNFAGYTRFYMTLYDRFEAVNDDFLKFDRVENKKSNRPDLHAFILLEELFPGGVGDLICHAEHDEIWLDIKDSQVASLSDEHILELTRCGIRLDDEDSLCMFV